MENFSFENWKDRTPDTKKVRRKKKQQPPYHIPPDYWEGLAKIYGEDSRTFKSSEIVESKEKYTQKKEIEELKELYKLFYTITRIKEFNKLKNHKIIKKYFKNKVFSDRDEFQEYLYKFVVNSDELVKKLESYLINNIKELVSVKMDLRGIPLYDFGRKEVYNKIYESKKELLKQIFNINSPEEIEEKLHKNLKKIDAKEKQFLKILRLVNNIRYKQEKITNYL
ncbi:hypothetical protein HRbin34_00306 [bacterium HR34]|nr:hypothetical protein HRbin34_00306 [bacterium HR34]